MHAAGLLLITDKQLITSFENEFLNSNFMQDIPINGPLFKSK